MFLIITTKTSANSQYIMSNAHITNQITKVSTLLFIKINAGIIASMEIRLA